MTILIHRRPALWLMVLAAVSGGVSLLKHGFVPIVEPDTQLYREFNWSSLSAVLSSIRTPGYPLFLRLTESFSSHPRAVPAAQWLAWILAGLWLHRGLCRIGYRPRIAVWSVGALWLSHAALDLTPELLSDSLGCSLAVAATGSFLGTLSRDNRFRDWLELGLLTLAAYLVRPAYLSLIPLWAPLALWLRGGRFPTLDSSRGWLPTTALYLLVTLAPFALYGTLRWAVVGHWGLVSFGGYNSIAIAAQFLTAEDLDQLPPEVTPMATEILQRIQKVPDVEPPSSFHALEQNYIRLQYPVILAAAADVAGDEPVELNRQLTTLANAIFRRHPRSYTRWLLWDLRHAIKQSLLLTISDPAVLGLLGLVLAMHAVRLRKGLKLESAARCNSDGTGREQRRLEEHVLCWSAVGLAAAQTLLIILVQPAIGRYMIGALALVPSAISTLCGIYAGTLGERSGRDPV